MRYTLIIAIFVNFVVLTTADCDCGDGSLKATKTVKSLESSNYPSNYCDNMDCRYNIEADTGYHVIVNITDFTTELKYDFVYVYDGLTTDTINQTLAGTLSSATVIRSSGNDLAIRFKTDGSNVEKGFRMLYWAESDGHPEIAEEPKIEEEEEECLCERQIYDSLQTSGEIKSPNYPDNICNTATYCVYEIEASAVSELNLLLTVEIKSSYKLNVYEIVEYEGRQIQIFWRSYSSTERKSNYFNFAKNVGARIVLEYDETASELTNCGFRCQRPTKVAFNVVFSRVKKDLNCPYPLILTSREPKTVNFWFKDDSNLPRATCNLFFITDPTMRIKIKVEKPNHCRATFAQFENNTEIRRIGNSDYYNRIQYAFESETNEMTIKSYKNDGNCQLQLTYAASDTDCKCRDLPHQLYDNSTTVTHISPGFPYSFCPEVECNTEYINNLGVNEKSGDVRAFLLTWNDLEMHGVHSETNLQLNVKVDDQSTVVEFQSEGNSHILVTDKLTINFKNINRLGLHGYNVTVEAVVIPKKCLCSNTYIRRLIRKEGSLELLLPASCRLIYCHYSTETSNSNKDELVFAWLNFQLAAEGDKLTIKDGNVERSFTYNAGREDRKFFSQKNFLLSFERDERTVGKNETIMDSKIIIKWKSGEKCTCLLPEVMATNEVKSIHSPNYPQPYCNNMHCIYKIEAEEGYHILINITEIDLENYQDHLYFYDGNSTEKELIKKFTGHHIFPPLVNSTANHLTINFHSDNQIVEKGFEMFFWAEPASSLNHDSGNSLSHGLAESHLSLISILFSVCVVFGVVILVLGVILLRKRGSFTFTAFRNPLYASPTVYYSHDNVSTRSFGTHREQD